MTIQLSLTLITGLISVVGSFVTLVSFFSFLKFRVQLLEKRIEIVESKEIPELKCLINQELKENRIVMQNLENTITKVSHELNLLTLQIKINHSIAN